MLLGVWVARERGVIADKGHGGRWCEPRKMGHSFVIAE